MTQATTVEFPGVTAGMGWVRGVQMKRDTAPKGLTGRTGGAPQHGDHTADAAAGQLRPEPPLPTGHSAGRPGLASRSAGRTERSPGRRLCAQRHPRSGRVGAVTPAIPEQRGLWRDRGRDARAPQCRTKGRSGRLRAC